MRVLFKVSLVVLVITMGSNCIAQNEIRGNVSDQSSNPLAYTNVVAMSLPDSIIVKGAITDKNGKFKLNLPVIDKGYLQVSSLGFQTQYETIVQGKTEYNFVLPEASNVLDDVLITYREQLFEKKPDRLVVNIQNQATAQGGTVLDILEKSPGVAVNRQNGAISLNGKDRVQVMINGKISQIPADAVLQMLDGMSSQNIENIELITNPSAKYEASGSSLININLLQNEFEGTNGSYGGQLTYNKEIGYGLNFNLSNRKGKWDNFISYNYSLFQNNPEWYSRNILTQGSDVLVNESIIDREPSTKRHNFRLGTNYSLSDKTVLSVLFSGYISDSKTIDNSSGGLQIETDSTLVFTGTNIEINDWKNAIISLGMDHKFNEDSNLSFFLDYLYYKNNQPVSFDNNFTHVQTQQNFNELLQNSKKTPINIWVGKLDYSIKLNDKLTFETGGKIGLYGFENDFQVNAIQNSNTNNFDELSSFSILNEKIYAGYISTEFVPNKKWVFTTGLRYEQTITKLNELGEPLIVDRNYGNFFPNITANYAVGKKGNLSVSYGKRINRPTFNELAPFAYFQSPQTLISGNSNLRPAITDNIELTYQPNKWWLSVSYSYTKDQIARYQPSIDDDTGIQLFRSDNLNYFKTLGAQVNVPIKIKNWLDFQNNISLRQINLDPVGNGDNDVVKNLNFIYKGSTTFILPKKLSFEFNAVYEHSPDSWGILKRDSQYKIDFGIKKKFEKNNGMLSLVVTDIFNSYNLEWKKAENAITDFDFDGYYKLALQGIRLSYTRNFGNRKLKNVNIKSGSDEDKKRVN